MLRQPIHLENNVVTNHRKNNLVCGKYFSTDANRAFVQYTLTNYSFSLGVVTTRPGSKVHITSLDGLMNVIDMKEWVASESNKPEASNPSIGTVLVTTFDPPSDST